MKPYENKLTMLIVCVLFICAVLTIQALRPPRYEHKLVFINDLSSFEILEKYQIVSARRCRNDLDQWGYELILERRK